MKHFLRVAGRRRRSSERFLFPPGLVLAFFLCAGQAFGQAAESGAPEVRRISVDEAVELAVQNNLSLESARIDLDTKKRASDLVWNQFLPEFDLRGTLSRSNEASTVTGQIPVDISAMLTPPSPMPALPPGSVFGTSGASYSMELPQWSVNGNFSATLTFSFALIQGIRKIKADYQTGLLSYAKARAQMERDIRKSYYQMLLLQENIDLLRTSYANTERQVAMAQANYNSGLAPQLTLFQAQVARDTMKPTIDQAENGLNLAMANFAMNLGLEYGAQFELVPVQGDPDYSSLDLQDLIRRAVNGKPDLMELRQTLLATEYARKAQALQLYTPALIFSWNYSPTLMGPWDNNWFDGDNWSRSGAFSITLNMSLNSLLPFTKQGQSLKDTDNALRSLNIGLAQAIRGTEIEIYNTILSLEQSKTQAETQAATVALAERSYRLTEEAYRAGLQDLLQVQSADLSLRQAQVQMLEQQFNYRTGLIDLEYSIGVPFGTLSNGGNAK
ncbi:MAG: TolC family protein [Treponema sp.]|jgi:outer membrane protein TolC|nr:TolC family protein [Treponema sp.]